MMKKIKDNKGTSLMETVVALSIFSIVLVSTALFISTAFRTTRSNKDRTFATQKALQMMNELRAYVEAGAEDGAAVLDNFDNGITAVPILTTLSDITDPAEASSGNINLEDRWKYSRRITVRRIPDAPNSRDVRYVIVRVYLTSETSSTDPSQMMVMAEIGGDIRTVSESFPPSQGYDIYLVALDNVPGWWTKMVTIRPLVENALQELENRNPGLIFRTHWITKLAYGRDKEYLPYINEAVDSRAPINYVYFYPARMPDPSSNTDIGATHYYVYNRFRGRVNVDGAILNDYDSNPTSANYNPYPYSLADQYNHAMRYYDELELFDQRVASGQESEEEPTLRLLLEDMIKHPEKFRNALFLNLHGELIPFPPVRNYADPAKDPENLPGVRVVTHPEQLRFRNTENVQLRVYAYLGEPVKYNTTYDYVHTSNPRAYKDMVREIKIVIPQAKDNSGNTFTISASDVEVKCIYGGIDADGDATIDEYSTAWSTPTYGFDPGDDSMWYKVSTSWDNPETGGVTEHDLLITLFNTPLKCKLDANSRGLYDQDTGDDNVTLYGLYYIPSPVLDNTATSRNFRNLFDTGGASVPKNTARWLITIKDSNNSLPEDNYLKIITRIGDGNTSSDYQDLRTGVLFPSSNQPANISTTYTWIEDIPPVTERYQFIGDPRHHPYVDQEADYDATSNPLGDGYNRFWDDEIHDPDDDTPVEYPGYAYKYQGWDGRLAIDVPRLFQIWRDGLLGARVIFTSMTGYSFYYVGIGNEIGYDAENDFPNSVPVSTEPFTGGAGDMYEQSITSGSEGSKWIKESDNSWMGLYWLGELYPDDQYVAHWKDDRNLTAPLSIGNLPTGSSANTFVRESRNDIGDSLNHFEDWGAFNHYPDEQIFDWEPERRTYEKGCASFFNGSTADSFNHDYRDNSNCTIQAAGTEISQSYNYPLPNDFEAWRPFDVSGGGNNPPEWSWQPWQSERNPLTVLQTFYLHSTGDEASSSVRLDSGADSSQSTYIVVNGLSPAGVEGTNFMARFAAMTVIHGFFEAGISGTNRVVQLPRIYITKPDPSDELINPSSLQIEWSVDWKKWNGEKYTSNYADNFAETESLTYVLTYSDDGGSTWKYVQDGSSATVGQLPRLSDGSVDSTHTLNSSPYNWPVSSGQFPQGTYFLRVEAYRDNFNLHYSYHQAQIYIKR